ncbi:hypothetical protein PCANC_16042 [Puccinia coronata f. sp. avenae]|uniref:Uncharacterized protein n=1 Tax=Puccinia coronata f. sp. avenae TaxID=200324 RepID=A0A2N5ULQ3_9BASI|nr:hypothetical protein PCANC_16042 [Puccinia coronata f. sp. avenae]
MHPPSTQPQLNQAPHQIPPLSNKASLATHHQRRLAIEPTTYHSSPAPCTQLDRDTPMRVATTSQQMASPPSPPQMIVPAPARLTTGRQAELNLATQSITAPQIHPRRAKQHHHYQQVAPPSQQQTSQHYDQGHYGDQPIYQPQLEQSIHAYPSFTPPDRGPHSHNQQHTGGTTGRDSSTPYPA